ncbi:MAG: GMC family oxidoreductase [Pseudomonadales bacterium]|nr:GMC family oxidoreductase [Pseudomonadales bacterium]MDP7597173.1 GMC family oxidoreductase [Pseudomonadales bacterium]HJN49006.1 GMC family oxidoreductase [Pseudomonadales bacterium]
MAQARAETMVHDVVIIGSGAGGGTVTKVLTDLGVSVVLMEAGPMIGMEDFKMLKAPYDVPHRGAGEHAEAYVGDGSGAGLGFGASYGGFGIEGEPYTVAPGSQFGWFRSRVIGGRTNHYGRHQLRFADYDFAPRARDGLGVDWPISYDEIAPYYDKAERLIGVTGKAEGIRSLPDGIFQPPAPLKVHEELVQRSAAKLGIRAINARHAIITTPTNGRPACHYCGQCTRGCATASNYASSYIQIFPAMQSGRVKVVPNAMARELITDASGKVSAVSYVDKETGTERQVRCRTVVLAASACESARLLLNSTASGHPDGVANSSGVVGRNLMDSVGYGMTAHIPAMVGMPSYNGDGYGAGHLLIPWWLWDRKDLDFPRGYHVEVYGGYYMPGIGSFQGSVNDAEGYGLPMKQAIREGYGNYVNLAGRGEMIPNENSYCEIDPTGVVDKWGIPVLRFHWQWGDYELNQVRHMQKTFSEIFDGMGGVYEPPASAEGEAKVPISVGGSVVHELGTVRMGDDPRTSVLNNFCQAHEVPNLFVADAAPFAGNPDKNPTHTIIALAWRTAEYLAEEMRKRNV